MTDLDIGIFAVASLFLSTLSSIAGGGGGFISTPLLIFLGLTPAEAIANGKFMGLSLSVSSVRVLSKEKLHSWSIVVPLMIIATIIGLIVPQIFTKIEGDVYQKLIGVLVLAMVPVMYYKKLGHVSKKVSERRKILGFIGVTAALFLQGLFSSGMGTLVGLSLVSLMGMGALEANVTRRFTQLLLNGVIVIVLLFTSDLLVWKLILAGVATNFIGGYVGAHIAIKKGNVFVMNVLMALMVVTGIAMLVI